jgi:RNA polymerase sigma-70 factor, ECF subfamily
MRRILVDYARSRRYAKRGGGARPAALYDGEAVDDDRLAILVEVDLALQRLAIIDPRLAQVVELRYFGGLSIEETAEVLKVASITVIRGWNFAKVWLGRELGGKAKSETGTLAPNSNNL